MGFDHFLSYIVVWCVGCIASIAGVGGGALLLPIFLFFLNLPLQYAIPTTIACIMGNSFVRATILYRQKHMVSNTSLIDYTVLWLVVPADTIGSFVGAWLSTHIDGSPLLMTVSIITFLTSIKTLRKGWLLMQRDRENRKEHIETVHIDGISIRVLPSRIMDTHEYPTNHFAKVVLFLYEFVIVALSICRVFLDMDYLFVFFIIMMSLLVAVLGSKSNNVLYSSPNIQWSLSSILTVLLAGFVIGAASTLVGVGGGMFVAPLLLYLDMSPQVMASTNSLSTFFSSFATMFQYIMLNRVKSELAVFCMLLSATSALVGLRIVAKSTWVIVVSLGFLTFVASMLMALKGITPN